MNVTCPLCGESLELDISRWRYIPSAPLVYEGIITCDCATGENGPLLIVRGGTEEEAEALARDRWEAMPHSRLLTEVEALDTLVEALDSAHRQTEMCIRKAAIGMKVTREDNAKYEEFLAQRDAARARLAEIRGEGKEP